MQCVLHILINFSFKMITSSNSPSSDEQYKKLTSLALGGLRLLSSWTAQVMELVRMLHLMKNIMSG